MNATASEEQLQRVEDFQRANRLGLATLFFSDLVGSTQLKQNLGDREAVQLIQAHHATYRELLAQFPSAEEIDTAGDSFFLVFATPSDATRFALLAQARTHALAAESGCPLRDRIGIHVGEVFVREADQVYNRLVSWDERNSRFWSTALSQSPEARAIRRAGLLLGKQR